MNSLRWSRVLVLVVVMAGLCAPWMLSQRGDAFSEPATNLKLIEVEKPEDLRPIMQNFDRSLAARGRSTFSELRWYRPMEAAKGSLSWVFRAKQPESVRTGP